MKYNQEEQFLIDEYAYKHKLGYEFIKPLYYELSKFYFKFIQPKHKSILDFGCGQGYLIKNLKYRNPDIDVHGYDPAVDQYKEIDWNKKFDIVVSNDVLEHIPEKYLDKTLQAIRNFTKHKCILGMSIVYAKATLRDGQNAHCLVREIPWWQDKLSEHFETVSCLGREKDIFPEEIWYEGIGQTAWFLMY